MATIVYRNARVFWNDADLSTALNDLTVDYAAEMLDETAFGDDTRIHKGGLLTGKISGKGFFDAAVGPAGAENVLFNNLGVDDVVLTVFANGITEGTVTDMGFAMKGVSENFVLGGGGPVGSLLSVEFAVNSRGLV